jgi:hypothetical protein
VCRKEIHQPARIHLLQVSPSTFPGSKKNRNLKEAKTLIMAQVMLGLLVVIVAACLLVAGMGFLALVILELREAPEGYEDEHGFHATRGSMIQNTRRSRSFVALQSKPIFTGFL